jgi:hypothetical protein
MEKETKSARAEWEYRVIVINTSTEYEVLSREGSHGWELTHACEWQPGETKFYFKRPK